MIGDLARHDPAATVTGVRLAAHADSQADSNKAKQDEQDARKSIRCSSFFIISTQLP
jgi:hypothetical protein